MNIHFPLLTFRLDDWFESKLDMSVKSSVVAELKDLLMPLNGFHEDSRHLMNLCLKKLVVAGEVGRDAAFEEPLAVPFAPTPTNGGGCEEEGEVGESVPPPLPPPPPPPTREKAETGVGEGGGLAGGGSEMERRRVKGEGEEGAGEA